MITGSKVNCYKDEMLHDSNLKLYMNGTAPNFVDDMKYLGVIVDQVLNFTKHINYLCRKIRKETIKIPSYNWVLSCRHGGKCEYTK